MVRIETSEDELCSSLRLLAQAPRPLRLDSWTVLGLYGLEFRSGMSQTAVVIIRTRDWRRFVRVVEKARAIATAPAVPVPEPPRELPVARRTKRLRRKSYESPAQRRAEYLAAKD